MNWIDMTDQDKLINYATMYKPDVLRIYAVNAGDSYYVDSIGNNIYNLDLIEYDIEGFKELKNLLSGMWSQTGFTNNDLLTTTVSAIAVKNMPPKVMLEISSSESLRKEDYESVNEKDSVPTYVYEF